MAKRKQAGWKQLQHEHKLTDEQIQDLQRQGAMQEKMDRAITDEFRARKGPHWKKVSEQLRDAGIPVEKRRVEPVNFSAEAAPRKNAVPFRHVLDFYSKAARRFVLDLANANDRNIGLLRKRRRAQFILRNESHADLSALRDELRRHWNGETLDTFGFRLANRPYSQMERGVARWHEFTDRSGVQRAVPILFDLPRTVAIALLEIAPDAGVCGNPDCPAPYFIKKRNTQRFCVSVCANYGQREHKREWWRAHGGQWRRQQAKRKIRGRHLKRQG